VRPNFGRLARRLDTALRPLADLIAPASCPICGAETCGSPFCLDCRIELLGAAGLACPRCALSVGPWTDLARGCSKCRGGALGFDAALALGPYQGPIRDLCLRLKHRHNAWLSRWLAELLIDARPDSFRLEVERDPGALAVPVPLHWWRRLERGYNQAEALADALSRRLALKSAHPLRRVVDTPRLFGLGRVERAKQLKDAFRCRPDRRLQGRTVLLIDDILTTGATCGAAARALKRAGAARVVAVVIARAEGKV
jgi:ComF family protein